MQDLYLLSRAHRGRMRKKPVKDWTFSLRPFFVQKIS